jgi:hypothetical protein
MNKPLAAVVMVALIGLVLPSLASAETFTFVCDPATETPPADWFGGPWFAPLKVVVDTQARSVELFDLDNKAVAVTARPSRLAGLNNYQMDIVITENVINWGVIEMWGFSGYIDRRTGRVDVIWTNPGGYSPNTLHRQFHGTCRQRPN